MSLNFRGFIGFFILFYILLIPPAIANALAEGNMKTAKPYTHSQKNNDISEIDTPHVVSSHIQTISNILTSSPAELAEQAKSYALGKFNRTVTSEAQKWLSQF
uniref:hypothetical protein n=1 Tax=Xenorhabdus beddingii TaxID=40578 RepID=UPI00111C362B